MEFKEYDYLSNNQLLDVIKQCIDPKCDNCDNCPFQNEDECRDTLLYNCMTRIQRLKEFAEYKDKRIDGLQNDFNDLTTKYRDMISERDKIIVQKQNGINNLNGYIAAQDITIQILKKELTDKDKRIEELEQELEEMEDSQRIIADFQMLGPDDDDLQHIVNHVSDICTELVQHNRIKPITLLRYIEDVIHDRERRRRVWIPDMEEME